MREDEMLRLSLECARLAVRGDDYEEVLVGGAERILRADAGAGLTTWFLNHSDGGDPVDSIRVVVSGIPPLSDEAVERARSVVAEHPVLNRADWFDQPTHRVSDLVSLPRFWDTNVWRCMHGMADGRGRFPASVNFGVHAGKAVFLGVHRTHSDFSDTDMETLDSLREPLTSALAFRAAWNHTAVRLGRQFALPDDRQFTRREGEVLALVARGWTNGRIGHMLGITERTVRRHLENVYAKIGVSNRAAATTEWLKYAAPEPMVPFADIGRRAQEKDYSAFAGPVHQTT